MAGQSQQACHVDISPPHRSQEVTLSSHASAMMDLTHPLAVLVHKGPQAELRTFLIGANRGVPVRAA